MRKLRDNFKCSIRVPEEKRKSKKLKNLFKQIMKENFPNLAKEIDFQESRKLRESQNSWTQGKIHQTTS